MLIQDISDDDEGGEEEKEKEEEEVVKGKGKGKVVVDVEEEEEERRSSRIFEAMADAVAGPPFGNQPPQVAAVAVPVQEVAPPQQVSAIEEASREPIVGRRTTTAAAGWRRRGGAVVVPAAQVGRPEETRKRALDIEPAQSEPEGVIDMPRRAQRVRTGSATAVATVEGPQRENATLAPDTYDELSKAFDALSQGE